MQLWRTAEYAGRDSEIGGPDTFPKFSLVPKAAEFKSVGAFVNFFASINTHSQFHKKL